MNYLIVPVSGGKDSQVCLSLAKARVALTGQILVAVHQNTNFDHPLTYEHLRVMSEFYEVEISHTYSTKYKGILDFVEQSGYFPSSVARGCTSSLKQAPFAEWLLREGYTSNNSVIWFGMRTEESIDRATKYAEIKETIECKLSDISEFYAKGKKKSLGEIPCLLPIVSWNTATVFQYLRDTGAPINLLYEKGHSRVGCYPCILTKKAEWVLAGKDATGREHIQGLVALEDKFALPGGSIGRNGLPRKLIKIHKKWDVRKFLTTEGEQLPELTTAECGYCSI
jgi:3'-phosphoadenosine 5'-phosphosulfate sulfotransferase (PAPS reductase)/FAD synthetase